MISAIANAEGTNNGEISEVTKYYSSDKERGHSLDCKRFSTARAMKWQNLAKSNTDNIAITYSRVPKVWHTKASQIMGIR